MRAGSDAAARHDLIDNHRRTSLPPWSG